MMADIDVRKPRANWPYGVALPHRYRSHDEQCQVLSGLVDVADDARAYAGSEPLRDVARFLALSLASSKFRLRMERESDDMPGAAE